jgi:amidase
MSETADPFTSASEMLAALRARDISAVELLELHERRIARYNTKINAIVETDFDRAHEAARDADSRRARGEDAPMLGLPITLKEAINVAGLRTTAGLPQWADHVAEHDAPLTTRVRAAGAGIMGKTNVPPNLEHWQSTNPVYGRTVNPWDASRTPGGSTGGGAAALAAGMTPLEYGSDLGGSIRVPAAFCGLYGHRPSETALPRSGQLPGPPLPNAAGVMSVQGPLARSAEDLELALGVTIGPEIGEDVAWSLQLPPARHARLADFRVAILPSVDWVPVDDEIVATLDNLATRLTRLGCRVQTAQPERVGDFRAHYLLYQHLRAAGQAARLSDEGRQQRLEVFHTREDEWADAQCRGIAGTAADYLGWHAERERYRAAWRAFFQDWDVVLSPAWLRPAFGHVDKPYPPTAESIRDTIDVNGKPVLYELGVFYPSVSTLAGQPATAFPVGLNHEGLPIGLQAIGPYLEDRTPIRFAMLLAREIGGFRRPPGYADA